MMQVAKSVDDLIEQSDRNGWQLEVEPSGWWVRRKLRADFVLPPQAAVIPSLYGLFCTNCATYGGHAEGCAHADPAPVTERMPEARCECGGAASGCGTHSTWCPAA